MQCLKCLLQTNAVFLFRVWLCRMSACCVCTLQSVSRQILLEPTSTEFQLSVCCSLHPLSVSKVAGQALFDANKDIQVHVSSPVYMTCLLRFWDIRDRRDVVDT